MKTPSIQDLTGWDATFDDTNIHFHGMQVSPHLFYPLGTRNPEADWITIPPENENPDQQCFCYVFDIAEDHPQGTFFWHIHRHGSAAMQGWEGMLGLLQVGNSSNPGSPEYELAQQGITTDRPLILWEWVVDSNATVVGSPNTYFEGQFIDDQRVQTYLTNNAYQPTFEACVHEIIHFRLLCAQTGTGSALYVLDKQDNVIPFWVFASDGISYTKAYKKSAHRSARAFVTVRQARRLSHHAGDYHRFSGPVRRHYQQHSPSCFYQCFVECDHLQEREGRGFVEPQIHIGHGRQKH
jgi:FtsP/CotA-like multicopper oxidase with cupredoxin domain